MKCVAVFLVAAIALASAHPFLKEKVIDENLSWKILGGSDASAGQFPYIISLRSGGSHRCGGSLIAPNKVLTAAHCVEGMSASGLTVVVGSHLLNQGGTSHNVASFVYHENWDSFNIVNDVAVITLSSDVDLADANVAVIPMEMNDVAGAVPCVLCGWGTTSYPGATPNNLQWIDLLTLSVADCQAAHDYPTYDSEVCTFTQSGEGACHGDSGGPLTAGGNQIGIVSWGMPCGIGYPDVFTRVSSFVSWIESH